MHWQCCMRMRRMKQCTDNIALQGERETNELNNKLAQFSENAMKFTMDGGLSAYDYKAEEEEAGEDVNFKALAGARSSLVTDSNKSVTFCIIRPYLILCLANWGASFDAWLVLES